MEDDLASRQPICEAVLAQGASFIFTAKPKSHKTMFKRIESAEISTYSKQVKTGRSASIHTYRWLNNIPLRDGNDALHVNWFELEITDKSGKSLWGQAILH